MILVYYSLFFLSLWSGAVRANTQVPLGNTSGENCLSLTGGSPEAIYDACCRQSSSGKGAVDGVEFSYTCSKWAIPYKTTAVATGSARECAQLCATAGSNCPAASWAAKGNCYFITAASYTPKTYKSILLLQKISKPTVEPELTRPERCDELVDAAKTQCEKDAADKCELKNKDLEEEMRSACEKQLASMKSQCAAGQEDCQTETSAAVQEAVRQCEESKMGLKKEEDARCQREKEELIQSGKAQCEQEKTSLTDESTKQCESEKAALIAGFESEKLRLQNALDLANEKLKAGEGTGESTTVSPTTPENEALVQDISRENFSSICPRFAGKTFTTVDSQGYKHEWTLYCHSNVIPQGSAAQVNWSCHSQNIIQLLNEQQEKPDFRGLWVNTNNVCTPWMGGSLHSGGPFWNHHLVLPTRQPWK